MKSDFPHMKTLGTLFFFLALTISGTQGQVADNTGASSQAAAVSVPAPTPYQVVEAGPHHSVVQWQSFESMPNGQVAAHTHSYTELASGLNYQPDPTTGKWQPAQDTIEPFAGGAVVRHCQHQIIFANNLNTAGAVDVQEPDGKRLRSNILGLMYADPSTGQAAQISSIKNSEGELVAANEVLYPDAFQGVDASILYKNRIDGMEQDVIIQSQLPDPQSFGMSSQNVYLEVFTELIDPPAAAVANLTAETPGEDPDQFVSWGVTSLGRGKAFIIGGDGSAVPVIKRYTTVGNRVFLLEKVRLKDIQQSLSQLPLQSSNAKRLPGMASTHFKFPAGPATKSAGRPMRLALGAMPGKGYVVDYTSLNSAYTNYTFQGAATYYLSSALTLSGLNNVFEGGTVIKYAANAYILFNGSAFTFKTTPFNSVLCTAKDDNTYGEAISGSTGNPSGYYGDPALYIEATGSAQLANFRMAYQRVGIANFDCPLAVSDAQFVSCQAGVVAVDGLTVNNALFFNLATNLFVPSGTAVVNNATFANDGYMLWAAGGPVYLTNCIFANVTNISGVAGSYNGFYQSREFGSQCITNQFSPFQRAGAGNCYLTNGTAFGQAGTPSVGPSVLALLANRTTHPPVVYSNLSFSISTNFCLQAQRDNSSSPDLGFHYFPLDYAFGGVNAKSNLTFAAGTAVAWFELPGSGGPGYGIALNNDVTATFTGTATQPCVFTRYSSVQEGGNGLWKDMGWLAGMEDGGVYDPNNPAGVTATFTHFYTPGSGGGGVMRDGVSGQPLVIQARHCEFYGGFGGYNICAGYTNCLFYRGGPGVDSGYSYMYQYLCNCTFYGGTVGWFHRGASWPSAIQNCAFDQNTTFTIDNTQNANNNYNACLPGATNLPPAEGANTITVTSFNWQPSWFGNYYLPSNSPLINQGTPTANLLGLYHFTTQTSQAIEGNSSVDIGYHYVATDANGNPLDTNGDGIPDYLEDTNGDGIFDAGDLADWQYSVSNPYSLQFTNGLHNSISIFEPKPTSSIP